MHEEYKANVTLALAVTLAFALAKVCLVCVKSLARSTNAKLPYWWLPFCVNPFASVTRMASQSERTTAMCHQKHKVQFFWPFRGPTRSKNMANLYYALGWDRAYKKPTDNKRAYHPPLRPDQPSHSTRRTALPASCNPPFSPRTQTTQSADRKQCSAPLSILISEAKRIKKHKRR